MPDQEFFREIEHREVPWGDRKVYVPLFYQEVESLAALFSASTTAVRSLLPSERIHPIPVSRRRCLVAISAHEFRTCDIGPYNEVGISVPFTLDKRSSIVGPWLGRSRGESMGYIHQLPVTTEIARDLGVELAGYPKFLARIEYEEDDRWRTCRLAEDGQHILTLAGRKLETHAAARFRHHSFTTRNGMLLRSELIISERKVSASRKPRDVRLKLGPHPIARQLASLDIGRPVGFSYSPSYQMILTPVLESLSA